MRADARRALVTLIEARRFEDTIIGRPCHRVFGADASLTEYGGVDRKRWLLAHERAAFENLVPRHSDFEWFNEDCDRSTVRRQASRMSQPS